MSTKWEQHRPLRSVSARPSKGLDVRCLLERLELADAPFRPAALSYAPDRHVARVGLYFCPKENQGRVFFIYMVDKASI